MLVPFPERSSSSFAPAGGSGREFFLSPLPPPHHHSFVSRMPTSFGGLRCKVILPSCPSSGLFFASPLLPSLRHALIRPFSAEMTCPLIPLIAAKVALFFANAHQFPHILTLLGMPRPSLIAAAPCQRDRPSLGLFLPLFRRYFRQSLLLFRRRRVSSPQSMWEKFSVVASEENLPFGPSPRHASRTTSEKAIFLFRRTASPPHLF